MLSHAVYTQFLKNWHSATYCINKSKVKQFIQTLKTVYYEYIGELKKIILTTMFDNLYIYNYLLLVSNHYYF